MWYPTHRTTSPYSMRHSMPPWEVSAPILFQAPTYMLSLQQPPSLPLMPRVLHANGSSKFFNMSVAGAGGPQQSARLAQQDIWRNVRIPYITCLKGYGSQDPFRRVGVPQDEVAPYESLVGIPVRGTPPEQGENTTFVIQSSYITVSVSQPEAERT
ncbi:hypothetical protein QBC46DRAFT_372888 [Diplogelasinospora grovesii]|uniref:Uncharacterized protein n=1 Tax=Diplogelasinospora grovesii TaxID=303347 RepID=A0AAN6NG15_9PEZI|nr:hypothetical protein QBC46DRAFT_372888 [Diplogelasinospora grovesii]